jgi:hypothetical protein
MTTLGTMPPVKTECPKCAHPCEAEATECPQCQVNFAALARMEQRRDEARAQGKKLGQGSSLETMALVDHLMIRQDVERLEAFIGFEQANNYSISDSLGNVLFLAAEESDGWARQLLKSFRPFTMHIGTPDGEAVLSLERPWRFYFHELDVMDAQGRRLGYIKKRWSLVNRRYTLVDEVAGKSYDIFGPFFKPWTFAIRENGADVGAIRKKWSGALREMFTDADVFGVEFPREMEIRRKAVFLGAVFLIDFLHFEDNNDN